MANGPDVFDLFLAYPRDVRERRAAAARLGERAKLWADVHFATDGQIIAALGAGWRPEWPPDPIFKPLADRVLMLRVDA